MLLQAVGPKPVRGPLTRRRNIAARLLTALLAAAFVVLAIPVMDALPAAAKKVTVTAQAVSYDLAVGDNQRVLVGLLAGDAGLVAFGTVRFDFDYLGTKAKPAPPRAGPSVPASYKLVAGIEIPNAPDEPRLFKPSQAVGVYAAENVRFDRAGQWRVTVVMDLGGQRARIPTTFTVGARHQVVAPGDQAPRTNNPVAGATGTAPKAIDSRAEAASPIPDPELHAVSVADALSRGRPVIVVVSTPTYCLSQFCGPITDSLSALSRDFGDRIDFVHLEVWKDYAKQQVNPSAGEWILPRSGKGDANEPWVFAVAPDGTVRLRLDNVASDADLRGAAEMLVNAPEQ